MPDAPALVLEPAGLDALVAALRDRGYTVVGPVARDGAIVYDELASAADLPAGWTDEQDGGHYCLRSREDGALFGYAVGPHSWKQFLFPPALRLWRATRRKPGGPFEAAGDAEPPPRYAFLGVRGCELAAIAVQDRVFTGGAHRDEDYAARREEAFLVAVECGEPAGTCFCVSMGTGPAVERGFDVALTEILGDGHRFLVRAGSERGAEVLAALPSRRAGPGDIEATRAVVEGAAKRMGRTVEAGGLRDLLQRTLESPRWDEVASRCLTCGNCTLVCPTCFCSAVEDATDLAGESAERRRVWDTCFSVDYSYIHGGSVRPSPRARYRQWLTHKFGTWHDQFGSSGCVGCGRCITWCPVAIDVTEELTALRVEEGMAP